MRVYDLIKKKRDGFSLTKSELEYIVKGAVSGEIPSYQLSAFLMAVYFKGMTEEETVDFTLAIANSGGKVPSDKIDGIKADKHSTGGVGDKTSLIISPIISALGLKVLKMSGRGLGHTGGTIDKLESIKGFRVDLTETEFIGVCKKVGLSIIGQTKNLAPADKVFYALRDVTATVDSIPLIASSIMGKKLTADDDVIVLDVKTGSGAFMKDYDNAVLLSKTMVNIGKSAGKKITAVITNMNEPLGNYVGNALEVKEAIDVLQGKVKNDLYNVCKELSAEMLYLSGFGGFEDCLSAFDRAIEDGSGYKKFEEFVAMQGGDLSEILSGNYMEEYSHNVISLESGYVTSLNAENVGVASLMLGAGRNTASDNIDYKAGIIINKKVGDYVSKGETLAVLYAKNPCYFEKAEKEYLSGLKIGDKKQPTSKLILGKIN